MNQSLHTPPIDNGDGTYNGLAMLSQLSGIPYDEVCWTAKRLQTLKRAGTSSDEAKAIVKREAQTKPWLEGGA